MTGLVRRVVAVAALALALSASTPAAAQRGVTATASPAAGSAQRHAILEALRPAIENRLGPDVEFVVRRIAVRSGWALVIADPQRRGGGRIDPSRHFAEDQLEGMDPSLQVNAILRYRGRGWTVVDHAIGPTDVWYCGVDGPPRALTGC